MTETIKKIILATFIANHILNTRESWKYQNNIKKSTLNAKSQQRLIIENVGLCFSFLLLQDFWVGHNDVNDNVTAHISNKCVAP